MNDDDDDVDSPKPFETWRNVFQDKNGPQYVEFGKMFHQYGATDWQILDYSDTEFRKYGKMLFSEEFGFQNLLLNDSVRRSTPASKKVSVVFKDSLILQGFIFVQYQQKREGEYSDNARTNRPFIQARFLHLTSDVIIKSYKHQLGVFSSLLIDSQHPGESNTVDFSRETQHAWTLKDYSESDNTRPLLWSSVNLSSLHLFQTNTQIIKGIVDALLSFSRIEILNNTPTLNLSQSILVVVPGLSLYEKLQIIDMVQYYVCPVLGIISFSLDAVVEQDVVLRFYNESAEKNAISLNKLNNIVVANKLSDYYEVASQLESKILYYEIFRKYLLLEKTTEQASRRCFLDFREFSSYQIENWISDVFEFLDEIEFSKTERDFLYDRLDKDELQNILSHKDAPLKLILSLLNYLREKKSGDLLEYMVFHLSVPSDKRADPLLESQMSSYLSDIIEECESNCLLDIPYLDRKQYYFELLLCVHDAKFLSEVEFAETVLASLLFLPGDDLFYSIKAVLDRTPNESFLDDFIFQLNDRIFNWSAGQVLELWNSVNSQVKSRPLYSALLNQLLGFEKNIELITSTPNLLKDFLYFGRELNEHYLDFSRIITENNSNGKSGELTAQSVERVLQDIQVLPGLEVHISSNLRKVVYGISKIQKIENAKFIEWWVLAELAYMDVKIIHNDLYKLQKVFSNFDTELVSKLSAEFKYIINFGQNDLQWFLHKACKNCDGNVESLLDSVNQRLLKALTEIWIEAGIALNVVDLKLFIDQLPFPNKLLAKISKSESQRLTILSLDALSALKWLEMTRNTSLRKDYLYSNEDDSLCELFEDFPSPSSDLAWHMLVVEEYILSKTSKWSDYILTCKVWKKRLHNKIVLSKNIETYLDIVLKIDVGFDDKFAKREIIKLFVNKSILGETLELVDFSESIVVGLCAYSRIADTSNLAKKIKLYANEFLIYFLRDESSPDKVKIMTSETQSELRMFLEQEKDAIYGVSPYTLLSQLEIEKIESKKQGENPEFEGQEDNAVNNLRQGSREPFIANKKVLDFSAESVDVALLKNNQIKPQKRDSKSGRSISDEENNVSQIKTDYSSEKNDYTVWAVRFLPLLVLVALFALLVMCLILLSLFGGFDVFKWLYFHFN